jgi:hypothetical protein
MAANQNRTFNRGGHPREYLAAACPPESLIRSSLKIAADIVDKRKANAIMIP